MHNQRLRAVWLQRWKASGVRLGMMIVPFCAAVQCHGADAGHHPLAGIEVVGISFNTPPERIAAILQAQGYTRVNDALYTKSEPAQSGRSTVYRVEIDETAVFRQLGYFRTLTGGRNKSPASRDAEIPASEMPMIRQLYEFVCNVPDDLQSERACMPPEAARIDFGRGQWVSVDARYSALLKASDTSTSLMIKYSPE
ncbi:MAG: hypothetical protein LZF61_02235 [Nitrosomonas sp.]|nr:MAG: hypothetical protein LZF61_02235 [Nitrosomonas sp.]